MATWLLPVRRLDVLSFKLWHQARTHLNIALHSPSPASLEIQTTPYPIELPDPSVFELMSDEYTSNPDVDPFTPLTSSDTLVSLVSMGDFQAAESLRKEMISHHIPIPHNPIYLRAALHAATTPKNRLDTFDAWFSLTPARHQEWQSYNDIRQRLFRSMKHIDLNLVCRFGLALASKGYYGGDAAMQVVLALTRHAPQSVLHKYLRELEAVSRDYQSKNDTIPPPDFLVGAYALSSRTLALSGKIEAALSLINLAHLRGIRVPDFTLSMIVNHAADRNLAIDRIQLLYPSWTIQDTFTRPVKVAPDTVPIERTTDIAELAARLRSLRAAIRSPHPPTPRVLQGFIESCQALGRNRVIILLRALAFHHSPRSASAWVFSEMLHFRSQRQPIQILFVFAHNFHIVGVPKKSLMRLIGGTVGERTRKIRVKRWTKLPSPMNEKFWPSAYHTALVWEAILFLTPVLERERLYNHLLSLVRKSKSESNDPKPAADQSWQRYQELPDMYTAAHFSPFVSSWARRSPERAAEALQDMVRLGIKPSLIQWSMIARGYAQHGDPATALRILDQLSDGDREIVQDHAQRGKQDSEDMLLGVHTNVLRGFVLAGDLQHAQEVEARLMGQFGYQVGERPATDACIALLRALEGSSDSMNL